MTRLRRWVVSGLAVFSTGLAGWIFTGLVTVWGFVYLWQCYLVLESPGVPIVFKYESTKGKNTVQAKSFRLDPWRQSAELLSPTVTMGDGSMPVRANFLSVRLGSHSLIASARGLTVEVRRNEDGSFNMPVLAPKTVPGKFAPAFEFRTKDALVTYTDVTAAPLRRNVRLRDVVVRQAEGEMEAYGTASTTGLDGVAIAGEFGPDGSYWLRFGEFKGDGSSLLAVFARYLDKEAQKNWGDASASNLAIQGLVEVTYDGKSSTDVRGRLKLSSDQVVLDQGRISGRLDADTVGSLQRLSVRASLVDGQRSATFDGVTSFSSEPQLAGNFGLNVGDKLWPALAKAVPNGMTFRGGQANGWLTFDNGSFGASGRGKLSTFQMQGERLDKVAGEFSLSGQKLSISLNDSRWRGSSLRGAFVTDLKTGALVGAANLPKRSFGPMLADLGVHWLQGEGNAALVFTGTATRPKIDMFAQGTATVKTSEGEGVQTGPFEARVSVDWPVAHLDRLTVSGANGLVLATGNANLKTKAVAADFIVGAFPLSVLSADASGTIFAKGRVMGTLEKPTYSAHVEGYGVEYKGQGAAQVVGEIRGDEFQMTVDSLRALSGTGALSANGSVDWKTKGVTGTFSAKNLSLSEWFGTQFLGTVHVDNGRISGPYDDLHFDAKLAGEKVNAYGAAIDGVDGLVTATMNEIVVHGATVRIGEGTISGQAEFGLADKTGSFDATAVGVPVDRLFRPGPELAFNGKIGGRLSGRLTAKGWNGEGGVTLSGIGLNGTPIGAGQLDLKIESDVLSVTGDIGSVDRYLSLEQLKVNLDDQSFDSRVAAYNVRVKDVLAATRPVWITDLNQAPDWVETLDGSFTGTASIASTNGVWSIGDSDLALDRLQISGRDAGKLVAKVTRSGPAWAVPTLNWKAGDSTLEASGTYNESGQMDLKATLSDFDLSWIKALAPDTTLVTGRASVTVVASGDKADPVGRASILVEEAAFATESGKATDPLHVLLDTVTFGNKRVDVAGHATFAGFTGTVSAMIPYSSVNTAERLARREPMSANIKFDERPLQDFRDQFVDIDMDKSDGRLALAATLTGFWEDLKVVADGRFDSNHLVVKNLDTELHNVSAEYHQNDRQAHVLAKAESGRGGRFDLDIVGNLAHVFGSDFNVDDLLDDSTLHGSVRFNQFMWAEKIPGALLPTFAKADGTIDVSGQLRSPVVSGGVELEGVVVNLPNEIVPGAAGTLAIDPQFDNILVTAGKGTRIETGVGALIVTGTGRIGGRLSDPDVNVPLVLQSGTFRLPSGRIALEPGGQLVMSYSSLGGGEPVARVDLDIEGHTTVVSRTSAGQYEPYQVTINIRGNAMDENNLRLTASSDPPDLSQDEILALIGQRDLIQGLAQGVLGGSGDSSYFREALYSFAIPSFAQNLTQGIATGLNLDYLSVDYNPFDQVLLSAGKTLGKGLVLHVTRQLQGTEFGPLRYEVKLEYRLPVADRFFSRVRLGFGFDQSVPWKLTLNWSKRF